MMNIFLLRRGVAGENGCRCLKSAFMRILSVKFCMGKLDYNVRRSRVWQTIFKMKAGVWGHKAEKVRSQAVGVCRKRERI